MWDALRPYVTHRGGAAPLRPSDELEALPIDQFTITERHRLPAGWWLHGVFNDLDTVREGRSWLYRSSADFLIGDLEQLDGEAKSAVFVTPEDLPDDATTWAWLDGWWQAKQVSAILDHAHPWTRVVFAAGDAYMTRESGWRKLRT